VLWTRVSGSAVNMRALCAPVIGDVAQEGETRVSVLPQPILCGFFVVKY